MSEIFDPTAFSGGFPHPEQWASQAGADLAAQAAIHPYLPRCNGFVVWSSAATNRDSLTGNQQMWVSPLLLPRRTLRASHGLCQRGSLVWERRGR